MRTDATAAEPRRSVLILTQPFDLTADPVVEELGRRGVDVMRFDTGWFPREASLVAPLDQGPMRATLSMSNGRAVDLADVSSIWYRRPTEFSIDERIDPAVARFCRLESLYAFGGALRSLRCAWMSHPDKLVAAEYKPYQLAVAARLGWTIPPTLVTNEPAAAKEFLDAHASSGVVYKPIFNSEMYSVDDRLAAIYTSRVPPQDVDAVLARVRFAPCLFQEHIEKAFEVRATVVGGDLFCVAIKAPEDAVDWRQHYGDLTYRTYTPPPRAAELCHALVHNLGLAFGAIDIIVRPDGEHVFLEVNPNGQWYWLEAQTGLPICSSIADYLAPFTRGARSA